MPERSQFFTKIASKTTAKLKWLENAKFYVSLRKGTLRNEVDQPPRSSIRKILNLKSVDLTISFTGAW